MNKYKSLPVFALPRLVLGFYDVNAARSTRKIIIKPCHISLPENKTWIFKIKNPLKYFLFFLSHKQIAQNIIKHKPIIPLPLSFIKKSLRFNSPFSSDISRFQQIIQFYIDCRKTMTDILFKKSLQIYGKMEETQPYDPCLTVNSLCDFVVLFLFLAKILPPFLENVTVH